MRLTRPMLLTVELVKALADLKSREEKRWVRQIVGVCRRGGFRIAS